MSAATAACLAGATALALAGAIGGARPRLAPWASAAAVAAAAAALAGAWAAGGGIAVDVPWLPLLDSRLRLVLDPLGAPIAVFAAALAAPVLVFTAAYLPPRLARDGRPERELARFCALLSLFAAAMVVLLLAGDLLVIFAALELTALVSFLLIRFDHHDGEARRAALVAGVVTVGSSLLFLIGALRIGVRAGSFELAALLAGDPVEAWAAACLVIGAIGKSAQVPLHFWLPRAMVAPTPVSAYLHAAALVAAGVFVLERVHGLLAPHALLVAALGAIGLASIAAGGAIALVADELKRILAGSTIAQYGYVLVLLSLGTDGALAGAPFFLVAHGLCKCALFLTAGAVTQCTGAARLSACGGLARRLPLLAGASAVAAAGLAGLPATIGYGKDEVLLAAALERGAPFAAGAVAAVAITFAYTGRFWLGVFAGARSAAEVRRAPLALGAPVALLAAAIAAGGLWTAPLEAVFSAAGGVVARRAVSLDLDPVLSFGPAAAAGAVAWLLGALLLAGHRRLAPPLRRAVDDVAAQLGSAAWGARLARAAGAASQALYRLEVRDLRDRLHVVVIGTVVFVAAVAFAGRVPPGLTTAVARGDLPVAAGLVATAVAAVAAVRPLGHLSMAVMLSFVGFGLALTFALSGAPDVALVIVLVETTLTVLFMATLARLRPQVLARARRREEAAPSRHRTAVLAGAAIAVVACWALAAPPPEQVAEQQVRLAEAAHARNVVTAVLVAFRGLDTAVEVTVLAVAVFGAVGIAWGRQP